MTVRFGVVFDTFDRVVGIISKVSTYGAMCLLVPWVIVFFTYIILRDFFHIHLMFVEEFSEYWMVIITCLALAYAMRRGVHVRIDIGLKLLPERVRNIVNIVGVLIALVTSCTIAKYGVDSLLHTMRIDSHSVTLFNVLLWPIYLWIPVGYSFLSLVLLSHLYQAIVVVRKT
jgi:C4-dicarboxylate transporter DctQ subunit